MHAHRRLLVVAATLVATTLVQAPTVLPTQPLEIRAKVFFRSGSARVRKVDRPVLDEVADVMLRYALIVRVAVEGHADGREARAKSLSQRRAEAVRDYLIARGVVTERLEVKAWGRERPITKGRTKRHRAKNRRVEFRIVRVEP